NLATAARFIPRYFGMSETNLPDPASAILGQVRSTENPYLIKARTGGLEAIAFGPFERVFEPLASIANVRLLVRQASAFGRLARDNGLAEAPMRNTEGGLAMGQCMATIAYAQLIAENAARLGIAKPLVSAMFHEIVL